jgi:hypothetical protein
MDAQQMNQRPFILSLTRIAFLNALALSFLSIQYVLIFSFLISIWIIPVIFALEIILTETKYFALSVVFMLVCSIVIFGISTGCWVMVYFFIGGIIGELYRKKFHKVIRVLLGMIVYAVSIVGLVTTFTTLVGVKVSDLDLLAEKWLPGTSIEQVLALGLLFSAFFLVLLIDYSVERVCKHLGY